jgi:hypothetical protein
MPLIALTMDKDEVDGEVVAVVTAILDYEFRVRVLTDPINADNKIAALEQRIRNVLSVAGGGWVRERELRQKTHADRSGVYFFQCAVRNLETISREIEVCPTAKKKLYRLVSEPENVATSVSIDESRPKNLLIQ